MSDDETCPRCGTEGKYVEVNAFGDVRPYRRIWQCCAPAPTAAQMAKQADDAWLAAQRRLVAE